MVDLEKNLVDRVSGENAAVLGEKHSEAGFRSEDSSQRTEGGFETPSTLSLFFLAQSDYDEGVRRITTLNGSGAEGGGGGGGGAIKSTITKEGSKTSKTSKDLEAVLGTRFEVKWDGPDDPKNPVNWSLLQKSIILAVVGLQALVVVIYSTSYISGSPGMKREFGISSDTTITLGMTTYLMGLAVGPLILAPMSELYGRRPVYLISLFLFSLLVIPACVTESYVALLVARFFAAVAGSVTLSNGPGSLGDVFAEENRALAFGIYYLAPMNGPVLGPIIGGFVYQRAGWRWLDWLVLIVSGVLWVLSFYVPETYQPVLIRKKAEKLRRETGDERYMSRFCHKDGEGDFWVLMKTNMERPLVMLITEPLCIFWAVYIAIIYGILYLCFIAYPIVFSGIRGWEPGVSGLAFCGIGVGTVLAVALDPISRWIYNLHKIDPETGKRPPEARIACICFAAVLSPASILWFAWTCVPAKIHWVWPILSGVPYGLGNTLIFQHGCNYLVTSYDVFAASALAGNTVARSILGGIMPLFGPKMYTTLGPNRAATVVALIAMALIPIPWGFYKWGGKVRARSPILLRLQKEREERGD